jgi:hypothetical protein
MDENWPFTSRAIWESERAAGLTAHDLTDDDPDPDRGNSLLRLLVEESNGGIVQLAPGVFYASKLDQR